MEEEDPAAQEDEEEDSTQYEVERILGYRRRPGRGRPVHQYLVQFKGYEAPEWTREDYLDCPAAVKEFHDRSARKTVQWADKV